MEQNRKPRNTLCVYGQMILDKAAKAAQWGKDSLFNKQCWENWILFCKRKRLDHYLTPYTKINSKQIIDLNVRPDTVEFLEEDIGGKLHDIGFGSDFLNMTPKAQATKAKLDKWDYIILKTSLQQRNNRGKRQPMKLKNISSCIHLIMG